MIPPSSRARVLGIALLAGALTQLALFGAAPLADEQRLEPGKPVDRVIRKGETHAYTIDVAPDHVVSGIVDQRGIDLVVSIIDPTGAERAKVDSPNGDLGPEPWSIDAQPPGLWQLQVIPFANQSGKGRYEARIDEVITRAERDERAAKQRYRSPRLLRLWKERRAEGAAAVARFVKEMEGHAPLVEPIEGHPRGDMLITVVGRFPPEVAKVWIANGPVGGRGEATLQPFEDTDLRYVTMQSPRDARFNYGFNEETNGGAWSFQADPWNPRHHFDRSLVELPGAPPQPYITRREEVPAGRVVMKTLHSDILGEDRPIGLYLPAAFDPKGGPYPYVVVLDGQSYGTRPESIVPLPVILDNLIAQGKVPPMLAVLVDNLPGGTRDRDLSMSAPFGDFLAKELAPWVRREHHGDADPAKVVVTGSSLGGLGAAYVAFHHPEVFGNVLSQSGSFWYAPGAMSAQDGLYAVEPGALMREIAPAPRAPLRWWMEVGLFEGGAGALAGSNMLAQNRHMRDVLVAKGYAVSYHEFSGGHDYLCWRGSLADGLMALLGSGRSQP